MAVTRRIGNLTIHFLGDNADQLAAMFDDAHYRSKTFKRDMDETSRTHRNVYVGSRLADLQDQPSFADAGFDPESRMVRERPAFGKAAGAETHFIVVKPGPHSLMHDDRRFEGAAQLALVHELLHPSQMIRELAEGRQLGEHNERRTQMREQDIAVELGKVPGKDFPDIRGSSSPYDASPYHTNPEPYSAPSEETAPFVPIRNDGPTHFRAARPRWQEASEAFEFPRYAGTAVPGASCPAT